MKWRELHRFAGAWPGCRPGQKLLLHADSRQFFPTPNFL